MKFTENQIAVIKDGLKQIARGRVTPTKVLSMSQVPERDKFSAGRPGEGKGHEG